MEANGGKHHPLQQIAESPTHKLLLKQWLKEEDLISRRVALKQAQIDGVRREISALCCLFFVFHSLVLALLFASSHRTSGGGSGGATPTTTEACRRAWIPCAISLVCSMGVVWAIRYKTDVERHMERMLERDEEDGLLLARCVAELKKKGFDFDLLKEVDALRRAKSLRVEAAAVAASTGSGVGRWSRRDFTVMFFLAASCAVVVLTRFVICH